ncbi:MAG: DNA-processing protein DprA [Eubacteriales bacterium]|jgi:DNA processing protein|nr:DNA-protecting protein DprA [Clostridiales bacterium]
MANANDAKVELLIRWIWFALACGPGSDAYDSILPAFDYDVCALYEATRADLAAAGADGALLDRLCQKSTDEAQAIWAQCRNQGIKLLTPLHKAYPKRLFAIARKPLLLYCRGIIPALDNYACIAAVGTRDMSEYGRNNAYTLSFDMARVGAIVVSGMARGIDGVCHRGALDAGGFTVAVLGCGIDRIYPAEHRSLYEEIARGGLILSEYKPGTPPEGRHFPVRNRIISGLCDGTLVVECSEHSGAMHTARHAMSQGRDLFALPGKVGEKNSTGVNKLIADGARIVTCASDIVSVYAEKYPVTLRLEKLPRPGVTDKRRREFIARSEAPKSGESSASYIDETEEAPVRIYRSRRKNAIEQAAESELADRTERAATPVFDESSLGDSERKIYALIPSDKPVSADDLTESGLTMSEIITALTLLEIKRAIRFAGGGKYIRIGGSPPLE